MAGKVGTSGGARQRSALDFLVSASACAYTKMCVVNMIGLEDFEGLSAYKKLVRKELLNTVRTNRLTLDGLVSFFNTAHLQIPQSLPVENGEVPVLS